MLLIAAFVLSGLTAASCQFMNFTSVSDEAFAMSNTDSATGEVTGVQDAGQIDASDFADGDEEASVDEEIEAAMTSTSDVADDTEADGDADTDEQPVCGAEGDKSEECGAAARDGRASKCCDGLICDTDKMKCVAGRRASEEFDRAMQSSYTTGLYRFPDVNRGDSCLTYPDTQTFDGSERAARAGAALAPLCAAVVVVFLLFECIFCNVPGMKVFLALLLLTAVICQGLTYMMLASSSFCNIKTVKDFYFELRNQKPCTVSQGGVYGAFATLLYFVSLVVLVISPKPEPMFCSKKSKDVNLSGADFRNEDGKSWTDSGVGTMT